MVSLVRIGCRYLSRQGHCARARKERPVSSEILAASASQTAQSKAQMAAAAKLLQVAARTGAQQRTVVQAQAAAQAASQGIAQAVARLASALDVYA